ncbi:MAG: hypothetical protein IPL95_01135 [Saprospiraceae bacterium]|nr:hypothetical protein [Saprospiraceae bacterium]
MNVPITACTGATAVNINCLKIVKEAITCKAKFEANYIGVDTNGHVTVKFSNQSYGEYKYVELNFGDGGFVTDFSEDIYYTYTKPGLYEACLIVSSDECSSETCQHLLAGSNSLICTTSDCVYPGDANKDGRANLYDLLMLGVGIKRRVLKDLTQVQNGRPKLLQIGPITLLVALITNILIVMEMAVCQI